MTQSKDDQASQLDSFREDVLFGLARLRKALPSRWLYDARGCELFEQITRVDDYYPTRTETAILRAHAKGLRAFCGAHSTVVEYGAGAAIKTEILLDALKSPDAYVPIDIAGEFLVATVARLKNRFPHLPMRPVIVDFTRDFDIPAQPDADGDRVAFFPGSTIGNLDHAEAAALLGRMRRHVGSGGRAVIGFDLIKNVSTLIDAYDDSEGITAVFNLNLLERMNRELDGAFPLERFMHEVRWNPIERAMEMHLVSLDRRVVEVAGKAFEFRAQETIHTESSRKYTLPEIRAMASRANWVVEHAWMDDACGFAVVGMRALSLAVEPSRATWSKPDFSRGRGAPELGFHRGVNGHL